MCWPRGEWHAVVVAVETVAVVEVEQYQMLEQRIEWIQRVHHCSLPVMVHRTS